MTLSNEIANAINQQIIDTEDYAMFNLFTTAWSVEQYGSIWVKIEVDLIDLSNTYHIAIENFDIYTTTDFSDAVDAIEEAYKLSLMQAVQF